MDVVLYERLGAVASVTLNRPDVHNAISPEMACRLVEAFETAANDARVRVVVVTGAGRAFSSGGDLALALPLLTGARKPQDEWDHRILDDPSILSRAALRDTPLNKPVVAAVNGHCLAGGFELLLGTDLRVASDDARFGLPEARLGLIPFAGALSRLPSQIPYCRAMEILLLGEQFTAQTALELGLVNSVVPAEDVMTRAMSLAQKLAENGPLALSAIKKTVEASGRVPSTSAVAMEDAARDLVLASHDAREGIAAFFERRKAAFQGR